MVKGAERKRRREEKEEKNRGDFTWKFKKKSIETERVSEQFTWKF